MRRKQWNYLAFGFRPYKSCGAGNYVDVGLWFSFLGKYGYSSLCHPPTWPEFGAGAVGVWFDGWRSTIGLPALFSGFLMAGDIVRTLQITFLKILKWSMGSLFSIFCFPHKQIIVKKKLYSCEIF